MNASKKFKIKYQNEAEKRGDYCIQDYITDLIGLRIICLYETEIPKIERIIRENFHILSVTDKTQALMTEVGAFGYKGLHFDAKLTQERFAFAEYARFEHMRVEIQLRSIVQDAWSEVEHRLRYKRQSPPAFQRRIFRLAALFELADQEFSALNEETEKLVLQATSGTTEGDDSRNALPEEAPLDSFSFLSMMSRFHPNYRFDADAIDGFVDEIKSMNKDFTLGSLKEAVKKYRDNVWKYKQFQRSRDININPFTEIRHVLYAYDNKVFADMLYPNQRKMFSDWLAVDSAM